jgi:DNA polymerase-1
LASLSASSGNSFYVDFENFAEGRDAARTAVKEVLSNGLIEKSVHDLKRAISLLEPLGVIIEGVKDDTSLAAYLLDPGRSKYELKDVAREAVNAHDLPNPPDGWTDLMWQAAADADLTSQAARVAVTSASWKRSWKRSIPKSSCRWYHFLPDGARGSQS